MSHELEDQGPDAESFGRVLDVGNSLDASDFAREDPPGDLWDRIASRLDAVDEPTVLRESDPVVTDDVVVTVEHRDDLERRRRRRALRVTLAAAAAIAVVAGIGVIAYPPGDDGPQVVASSTLEVLDGPASAQAELISVDGEKRLVVRAEDMPPAPDGSHYELWLVDPDVTDPRSLGPMTGSTEVTVPNTIDTTDYPVVDISLQQNGTIEHSGHSLLRGTLS